MANWTIRQIFDGDYGCEERLPGDSGRLPVAGEFDNTELTERYLRWNTLQEKTHLLY